MSKRPGGYLPRLTKKARLVLEDYVDNMVQDVHMSQLTQSTARSLRVAAGRVCARAYSPSGELLDSTKMNIGIMYSDKIGRYIDKGDGYGDRTGSRIYMRGLEFKWAVTNIKTSQLDHLRLRVALLHNKRVGTSFASNSFAPEGDTNNPTAYATGGESLQLIKKWNTDKFNVLFNKVYNLPVTRDSDPKSQTRLISEYIKINKYFQFNTETDDDERIFPDLTLVYFLEGDRDKVPWATGSEPVTMLGVNTEHFKDI